MTKDKGDLRNQVLPSLPVINATRSCLLRAHRSFTYWPPRSLGGGPQTPLPSPGQGRDSQGLSSQVFPNYSRSAVDTNFTLKEFSCRLLMHKGWTLESWQEGVCMCLRQKFTLKENPPVGSL